MDAKQYLLNRIKSDMDFYGKLNSKWVIPIAQIMEDYAEEKRSEGDSNIKSERVGTRGNN